MRNLSMLNNVNTLFIGSLMLISLVIFQLISQLNSLAIPTEMPIKSITEQHRINLSLWHLFGKFDQHLLHLPKTHLHLTLEGTIADKKNPKNSYALINDGQKTKIYRIGDHVTGASIQNIHHHDVILKNHGELEKLMLPIRWIASSLHGSQ